MRNRWLVGLVLGVASIVGCGDDDADHENGGTDAATEQDSSQVPGECSPARCPVPESGASCCTANAECGALSAFGTCVPNDPSSLVCVLAECPLPATGLACCLPTGRCGQDPLETGGCYPNPPRQNTDAGAPTCDLAECPSPDVGIACCMPSGRCGVDITGLGFCALVDTTDAGTNPNGPPDDPSITGECPSYLAPGNVPVWGCCSRWGVCGTFLQNECLLPLGTQLPVPADRDHDAGIAGLCTPPAAQ